VDIGASIGVFSVYAAATAKNVTIYAYEPMAQFYQLLCENVRLNNQGDVVKCFNCAVAAEATTRSLFTENTGFFFPTLMGPAEASEETSVPGSMQVACTTLADIIDSNNLETIDLLKMDCEGAEYEIFATTPASYLARIKEIRMEYHNLPENQHNVDWLKERLMANGYKITHMKVDSPTNGSLWAKREAVA
ncbi:MAG: FkbM family methyltransferase, partial [Armatimonadota bacterium]|nr:FkbM family methyltransferase [Armatimonadota bacterium]